MTTAIEWERVAGVLGAPPVGDGWEAVDAGDPRHSDAACFARDLIRWLPLAHYVDALSAIGLYRFYRFETPGMDHIAAYLLIGDAGEVGGRGVPPPPDSAWRAWSMGDATAMSNGAAGWYQDGGSLASLAAAVQTDTTNTTNVQNFQTTWNTEAQAAGAGNLMPFQQAGLSLPTTGSYDANTAAAVAATLQAASPGGGGGGGGGGVSLSAATTALVSYLGATGCNAWPNPSGPPSSQTQVPAVMTFQTAYNASGGSPGLAVDGNYGPCTMAALSSTITSLGLGGTAAASCFPGSCGAPQNPPPSPSPTPTPSTTSSSSSLVWIILAVLAAGGIGTAAWAANG